MEIHCPLYCMDIYSGGKVKVWGFFGFRKKKFWVNSPPKNPVAGKALKSWENEEGNGGYKSGANQGDGIRIWLFVFPLAKLGWATRKLFVKKIMKSLIAFTLLSLVLNLKNAHCQLTEDSCKRFANILPHKLRELRVIFNEIKDYFVSMTIL